MGCNILRMVIECYNIWIVSIFLQLNLSANSLKYITNVNNRLNHVGEFFCVLGISETLNTIP